MPSYDRDTIQAGIETLRGAAHTGLVVLINKYYLKTLRRFARTQETLADLTADNVNDYLESVADHPTMARNDCIALRQLSQWATKAHIFPSDPLASVELPRGRGGKRKPFADAEIPTIIHAASDSSLGPRDKAVVILGLSAALRPTELWQLQLSDVDLREGWVTIRGAYRPARPAGDRCARRVRQRLPLGHRDGPLFLNNRGGAFSYWGFMGLFARLHNRLRAAGIEFQSYRMRHTGTTNWARAGVEAPILKELAGHKSIVTTQN